MKLSKKHGLHTARITPIVTAQKLKQAEALSRMHHGNDITFYLPGMFRFDGTSGKYPNISITGEWCALQCDHCRGKILHHMRPATTPDALTELCFRIAEKGNLGVLISGGCDEKGRLPWSPFLNAISRVRRQTTLHISIHCGILDAQTARDLKAAGVDAALIDIVGSEHILNKIYHADYGMEEIHNTLAALETAGLETVPHIVCGLDYGNMQGEGMAVDMLSAFKNIALLTFVGLMPLPGTPMADIKPPHENDIAELICEARVKMPRLLMSLGCARQRGNTRLELLAIDAGINRMALPSDEAVEHAGEKNLDIHYQPTCCSVAYERVGMAHGMASQTEEKMAQ